MSEQTKIAWCDSTVNFWSGCTKVSAGCANCYAEGLSKRGLPAIGGWGKGAERKRSKSAVKDALAFNRKPWVCDECGESFADKDDVLNSDNGCFHINGFHRRRIFSLSLGDWLDDEVPIEWLAEMLDIIQQCDQVTWMLCSKRWENWRDRITAAAVNLMDSDGKTPDWLRDWTVNGKAPSNIIGLCSVENQEMADKRIPQFLSVPLACRGLSLEPLLGPVQLTRWPWTLNKDVIHWLIIGGESGPNARPCNVDWIRSIVAQGKAAGVATFVKQLGANPENVGSTTTGKFIADKKGGDPSEWPQGLRVQEWPKGF